MSKLIHDKISLRRKSGIIHSFEKKPRVTNTKGPTRLWVPKSICVCWYAWGSSYVLLSGHQTNTSSSRGKHVWIRKEEGYTKSGERKNLGTMVTSTTQRLWWARIRFNNKHV